jgi:hypothetical protein
MISLFREGNTLRIYNSNHLISNVAFKNILKKTTITTEYAEHKSQRSIKFSAP